MGVKDCYKMVGALKLTVIKKTKPFYFLCELYLSEVNFLLMAFK